jgi:hypothetical protein
MKLSNKYIYEGIAEDVKHLQQQDFRFEETQNEAFSDFIDGLCFYFRQGNPSFDRDKFIKACGFEDGLYPDETEWPS